MTPRALAALAILGALLAASCAPPPPPPPPPGPDRALVPFLPDPSPLSGPALAAEVERHHRRLLSGSAPAALAREAEELLRVRPDDAGARLFLAEARLAAGEAAAALAEIARLAPPAARARETALVAGGAAERIEDPVAAVAWYRLAGGEAASGRARALEPRAVEILLRRGADLVARGRLDEAERALAQLEAWRPAAPETLELARAIAAGRGDPRRELAALRALAPARPETLELQLRRGALEVEVGDARAGLDQLSALASRWPHEERVATELGRAKLLFRLQNSPEPVRAAAARAQLTRAEFARLLYWLVPDVRAARGGAPRIASDILDHPARDEIVRVVNLGLLALDEVRHLFEPDRPVARGEALAALLADPAGGRRACAAGAADACAAALACGLLAEAGECLPAAPLAGREAVEWIRRVPEAPGAER
jgi:hypothetical protein